jgi:benzoate transport
MTVVDPIQRLNDAPMTRAQVTTILLAIACVALDGFDILAISYSAPGIANEWHIDRGALGIVLSMELLGMALGSISIGALADRAGRRTGILVCLSLMCTGMAGVTMTSSIASLCAFRVLTGLGIGGMFAAANAIVSETSNSAHRDLCVTLMTVGYPVGAIIAGLAAETLLQRHGWRSIFSVGAAATFLMIPLVYLLLAESLGWLCSRRPRNALKRLNESLRTLGHDAVDTMPLSLSVDEPDARASLTDSTYLRTVILLTLVYTLHFTTFYFLIKWVPKIVVDLGYPPSNAARVLIWVNVGTAIGGAGIGLLAKKFSIQSLTGLAMFGAAGMVWLFGSGQGSLAHMGLVCLLTGICTSAGGAGMYAIIARSFPPLLRASGTGIVIGFGRGGTVLAPILAGYLFSYGYGLQRVALVMGSGSLMAAILLATYSRASSRPPLVTRSAH